MKNWWKKVKEFFSRPKVIKWTIAILTLLIVTGSIKALVWTIYTKDKPDFIPEKVREDIQGVINESGEAIKTISDHIGTAIVDAGYEKPDSTLEVSDPTVSWETYTNEEFGITIKYPKNWSIDDDSGEGVLLFSADKGNEYTQKKKQAAETDFPYWGGIAISVTETKQESKDIYTYIVDTFGIEGVSIENVTDGYYVVDKGPNRYGGGTGFYYYKVIAGRVYEFSLDYFEGQPLNDDMINTLKLIQGISCA